MKQTPRYQLCQWENMDRILMEDFNEDNRKIDTALAEVSTSAAASAATLAQHAEVLPKLGNCQLYSASYVGNGNGYPGLTLTFPHPVKFLAIMPDASVDSSALVLSQYSGYYVAGGRFHTMGYRDSYLINVELSNSGKTYRMYRSGDNDGEGIMNVSGRTYHVTALLAADEG